MRKRLAAVVAAIGVAGVIVQGVAPSAHAVRCNPAADEVCHVVFGTLCEVADRCIR